MSHQGSFGNALASTIEDYRYESPLEHDAGDANDALTAKRAQFKELKTKAFAGVSNARGFRAGDCFTLADHPVHDHDSLKDRTFLLTGVSLEAINNLPKTLSEELEKVDFLSNLLAESTKRLSKNSKIVYRNEFECVRAGIPILPEEMRAPYPGLHTATVVGLKDSEVHTDELARIRIRLHCTREEEHREAGASGTEKDSTWIRMLQPGAGLGMGGRMLPRVGDETVVDFLGSDPDRPIIIGCLSGGLRPPCQFSDASVLPGDKLISGFRSRMDGGQIGNELLFDDTPHEIRARLASDHAQSELNLGVVPGAGDFRAG